MFIGLDSFIIPKLYPVLACASTLVHEELEFSRIKALNNGGQIISEIGILLPIALCGQNSLSSYSKFPFLYMFVKAHEPMVCQALTTIDTDNHMGLSMFPIIRSSSRVTCKPESDVLAARPRHLWCNHVRPSEPGTRDHQ